MIPVHDNFLTRRHVKHTAQRCEKLRKKKKKKKNRNRAQ